MRTLQIIFPLTLALLVACGGSEGDAFDAGLAPGDITDGAGDPQFVPPGTTADDLEAGGQISDDFSFDTIGDVTISVRLIEAGQPVSGVPVRVFTVRERLFDENDPDSGLITEPGFQIAGMVSDDSGLAQSSVLLPLDESEVFVRVLTPGFGDAIVTIVDGAISTSFQRGA